MRADYELHNLLEPVADTHRTVTLRIPKGMTISNAMWEIRYRIEPIDYFWEMSDTDLQKALDEVQG